MINTKRLGIFKTIGKGALAYEAFVPNSIPFNPDIQYNNELIFELVRANQYITELNTVSSLVSFPSFIPSMIRKEALLSSQIEGTQATIDDIYLAESTTFMNDDVEEVFQYQKAYQEALQLMKTLPLSLRFIKTIHQTLMQGVRGQDKEPGEFRKNQNWIGGIGSTIQTAQFVPPPVEEMHQALFQLEQWIHEDKGDHLPLVNAGLLHYQFETIHPFLDGNGRIGRMLMLIYLIDKQVLSSSYLYLSFVFKKHQQTYYRLLDETRRTGQIEAWLLFFFKSVSEACEETLGLFHRLQTLKDKHETLLKKRAIPYLRYLESHPIFTVEAMMKTLNKPYDQINRMVNYLRELKIISMQNKSKKNRVYVYESLINLLR
jgi:Fic family protein